jgi:uncharacterized phiE125 gp8 family phage protein
MPVQLADNALVTRADVKTYLDMTGANTAVDDLLHTLINEVSTAFETYCGRKFVSDTYTEYFDGGSSWLFPKNLPITSITGIWEDADWLFTDDSIDSTEYRLVEGQNAIYYDGVFEVGVDSIKMTYVAGYTNIPEDLKMACILQVAHLYRRRDSVHLDGETKADTTSTFSQLTFLPQVIKTLNSYRHNYIV